MKAMIDTNVILDCMLDRKPFSDDAEAVLEECTRGIHTGCIFASTITDIFYIARKAMNDLHEIYLLMDDLLEQILLVGVSRKDLMTAMDKRELDFEDCLLSVCAESTGCDVIITRNVKGFSNSNVPAITPEDFISRHMQRSSLRHSPPAAGGR